MLNSKIVMAQRKKRKWQKKKVQKPEYFQKWGHADQLHQITFYTSLHDSKREAILGPPGFFRSSTHFRNFWKHYFPTLQKPHWFQPLVFTFHSNWQDGIPAVVWAVEALQLPARWWLPPWAAVTSAFLLPALLPLPSVLFSCFSLSLRVSSRRLLTIAPFLPSYARSTYDISVSLAPPLCPSIPPIFHVMSACLCWTPFFSSFNP